MFLRHKAFALVAAVLGLLLAVVSVAHIGSLRLAGSGINEAVLYHLIVGLEGAGFGEYHFTIVLIIGLLFAAVAYGVYCYHLAMRLHSGRLSASLAIVVLVGALGINPGLMGAYKVTQVYLAEVPVTALPDDLVYPREVGLIDETTKPKNLVLIYAESLEASYFDADRFPGLMPRLSAMREKSLSFSRVESLPGMTWTIGGMVASQCGVPLVTASNTRNANVSTEQFLSEAHCMGDILSQHGYQLHYMGGADSSFADKNLFYESHGAWHVEGREQLELRLDEPRYVNQWGLYDDSLLEMAKTRFDSLAGDSQPFALSLLTLDTHHPKGHVSQRCRDIPYGNGDNPILNAVHCSDQLLAEFVDYVLSAENADETLVVVMSDHLALPNSASDVLAQKPRHNLLMMPSINTEELPEGINVARPSSLMDVGATLLHQMGFDIPALGYGRNLLAQGETFMEAHAEPKTAIRERFATVRHLWQYPSLNKGLKVELAAERALIGTHEVALPAMMTFQDNLRLDQTLRANQLLDVLESAKDAISFVWVDKCNVLPETLVEGGALDSGKAELCLLAGKGQGISWPAMVLQGKNTYDLSLSDLEPFLSSPSDHEFTRELLQHLRLKSAGGEVVSSSAREMAVLAKAIPLPGHAFIEWKGLNDRRRLLPEIIVPAWQANILQPEFDIREPLSSSQPEYRSAWVAAAIKDERVLADYLSPGGGGRAYRD
ncbi:sulfatase-like hydrolase/transferase [Vreelandella arctica]|uniref:sulfatase-like hydrolase/transferase n=1 Tax=Vreelandella arctica TaxID=3126499 RepID=UPI00300E506B